MKNWLQLIDAGEPYRLLFPLGAVLGIVGVMLWPAHVWLGLAWPNEPHAGLMIQGFLASFVIGFLGTALPRLLEVPKVRLAESLTYAVLLIVVSGMHLSGRTATAHAGFLILLIAFITALLLRARHRQDIPPPGFTLVIMGLLSGLIGTALLLLDQLSASALTTEWYLFARRLLHQGFLLLPIMGVGAFLLPRFFGLPNRQAFPESLTPPPGWWNRAFFAAGCGLIVWLSFALEAYGFWRVAFSLRAIAFATYCIAEIPFHQARYSGGSLTFSLRIALISIPVGYLWMVLQPQWQTALIHIVFIAGFSLLTFTVASRVALGHSGQSHLFQKRITAVLIILGLLLLAMLTRVSADWMPVIRLSHYAYAAICWAAAAVVWLWRFRAALQTADS